MFRLKLRLNLKFRFRLRLRLMLKLKLRPKLRLRLKLKLRLRLRLKLNKNNTNQTQSAPSSGVAHLLAQWFALPPLAEASDHTQVYKSNFKGWWESVHQSLSAVRPSARRISSDFDRRRADC